MSCDYQWVASRLASSKPNMLAHWKANTPPDEAAYLLLEVLWHYSASPEKGPSLRFFTRFFINLGLLSPLFLVISNSFKQFTSLLIPAQLLLAFILTYLTLNRKRHIHPKIARKAALMLAQMDDERAIPYLAACWQATPVDEAANESITHELTRLTEQQYSEGATPMGDSTLRAFMARTFPLSSQRDLTEAETDMFLAVLRLIGQSEGKEDRQALEKIARMQSDKPNHAILMEAARQIIAPSSAPALILAQFTLPVNTQTTQQIVLGQTKKQA